jgi:hypothetical protein
MLSNSAEVLCGGAAMVIEVALHISKSSAALFNRCATANNGSAAVVSGSASAAGIPVELHCLRIAPQRIMVALQWLAVAIRGYE